MPETPAATQPETMPQVPLAAKPRIGPVMLFIIFSGVAITGFGGVLPFAYHALVEKRRLFNNDEFAEMLSFGQVMPGPAVANLALIVGYRDCGALGATTAVLGLVTLPMLLMTAVGMFYAQYAHLDAVRNALTGMATVTGGLVVATALKMSRGIHKKYKDLLLLLAAFGAFGLMRWPFLAVISVLAPVAIWAAWMGHGAVKEERADG